MMEGLKFTSESFVTLDVWQASDAEKPKSELGTIVADEITSWISKGRKSDASRTRILICPRAHEDGVRITNLPFKQEIYDEIARLWHLPSEFPEMYLQFIPFGTVPLTVESSDGLIEGYMLKSEYNRPFEFAAVVLHNASANSINFIVFGLKDGDDAERKRLVTALTSTLQDASCPLWLPTTILSLTSTALSLECARTSMALWGVQARTGLHGSVYGKAVKLIQTDEGNPVDVEQCIVDLTAVLDQCARLRSWTGTMGRMVDTFRTNRSNLSTHRGTCRIKCRIEAIEAVGQTVKGAEEHLQWFQDSASSHLQTVYQITNQRDSQLNRLISERAQMDGSNMLLIAAVTMLFLPGGFVATFFSMSMFQFEADNKNAPIVSDWIWLYFLATGLLTAGVFGLWRYLTWKNKKTYAIKLRRART